MFSLSGQAFGHLVAVVALCGFVLYLASCGYHRCWPAIDKSLEALGFAAAIIFGFRMIYGAFHPHELCHIIDEHEKVVELAGHHLSFGEHTWEIAAGGIM